MKMNVLPNVLMVNLHVMTVPVYQVVGNAMYTGVTVLIVLMKQIVAPRLVQIKDYGIVVLASV